LREEAFYGRGGLMAKARAGVYNRGERRHEGRTVIETRIELPGAPEQVREFVGAADAMLHERAKNSQGLKFSGVWTSDGSTPVTERVRLTVRLGQDELSRPVTAAELADPRDARDAVRDAMRGLLRESSHRSAREIVRLVEEIRSALASELATVGQ
jgi:hypothetical protein